jgi:DASH complex subunit DAD1
MASTNGASTEKSYFEHQRELLIGDVAASLENVLQNMNRLNRSLEGVIAVRSCVSTKACELDTNNNTTGRP